MKRTQQIVLVLSGALAAAALSGCSSGDQPVPPPRGGPGINYTNNQFVQGVGYFHAPYRGWYLLPYNFYDASRGWYRGGIWYSSATLDTRASSWSSSGGGGHYWSSGSGWSSSGGGNSSGSGSSSGGSVSRGGFGGSGGSSGS